MQQQQPTLPHIFDALEWQEDCRTIAAAAVRLAERIAADHGQRLRIVKPPESPSVELCYEGNPYRAGGGSDDPRREPPTPAYARALAQEAIQLERHIGRRIEQAWNALSPEEQAELQARNGGRPPLQPKGPAPWDPPASAID